MYLNTAGCYDCILTYGIPLHFLSEGFANLHEIKSRIHEGNSKDLL